MVRFFVRRSFKKSYTVKVNNNTYTVAISNPLDILIKEMGFETELRNRSILSKHLCRIDSGNQCCGGSRGKRKRQFNYSGSDEMENSFLSPLDGIIKSFRLLQEMLLIKVS
jgi:hypothetical protein